MDPKLFKQGLLDELYEPYRQCYACPLGLLGRKHIVFGEGNPDADIMFIGEAPGRDEDNQGRPFVGRSGMLLNKALVNAGIKREDVFIANIVKCRPPNNRPPAPLEATTCKGILLHKQIKIIRPSIICTLGSCALNNLFDKVFPITKTRGTLLPYQDTIVIPTFHPAYILRNPAEQPTFFNDILLILEYLKKA